MCQSYSNLNKGNLKSRNATHFRIYTFYNDISEGDILLFPSFAKEAQTELLAHNTARSVCPN